ncbi:MAG: hypothetical protein R2751_01425 [Bacteroidales bacterium]
MRTTICTVLLMVVFGTSGIAQDGTAQATLLALQKDEQVLDSLFQALYEGDESDREHVQSNILRLLPEALVKEGAMAYPWRGLSRIGVIQSGDGLVRIFSWHIRETPDSYTYYAFAQVSDKKGSPEVYPFSDNGKPQRNASIVDQTTENWYGKLYYRIIEKEEKRNTYYTLLGMDFNSSLSIIKSAEVLELHRTGPRFVKGMFHEGGDRGANDTDRFLLEYSTRVSVSLQYDENLGLITFNHLVPMHPIYEGNFEFYEPDGSYDAFEFVTGTWVKRNDIDARLGY